jgi:hypothetical protein
MPGGPFPVAPEEEVAVYLAYADRYGWTPEQVDALPAYVDTHLLMLADVLDEVRQEAQRKANQG